MSKYINFYAAVYRHKDGNRYKPGYDSESNRKGREQEYRRNGVDEFHYLLENLLCDTDNFRIGDDGKKIFLRNTLDGKNLAPDNFLHELIIQLGVGKRVINFSGKKSNEVFVFTSPKITNPIEWMTDVLKLAVQLNWDFDAVLKKLGLDKTKSFSMRQEQAEFVLKAYDYFKKKELCVDGDRVFLGNCKCRFGKTFAAYQLMKKMGAKNVVVLTYKAAVEGEWESNLKYHVDFGDYNFYAALNYDKNHPIKFTEGNSVLFGSFPDILGKDCDGNVKNKWKYILNFLKKTKIDLLIIDEAHFGAGTKKANEIIDSLNYTHRLNLSGTPLDLLMSGDFTDENTYTWSYVDEQEKKRQDVRVNGEKSVYFWLPELHLYRYELGKDVIKDSDAYTPEEGLKLNKFFASTDGERFVNHSVVEKWLDLLAKKDERLGASPFNNNQVAGKLNHLFWMLPDVNSCRAMLKALRNHYFFKDFCIVPAFDDNDGEGRDTVQLVRDSIRDNGKTITLSCGKLNTGITIPKWNSLFYLTDTESPETYWQTVFRVQSSCEEIGKKECSVFDFNPNRTLKMIYEYCEKLAKKTQSTPAAIREFLDVVKVFSYEDNRLVKMTNDDLEKIIESVIDVALATGRFGSPRMVSVDKLTGDVMVILATINVKKGDKNNIEISTSDLKKGKTFKGLQRGKGNRKKSDPLKLWVEKALTLTRSLPMFLFVSEADEESVKDILNTKETELFKEITTVAIADFKKLLDCGFLIEERIDRSIQALYLADKGN